MILYEAGMRKMGREFIGIFEDWAEDYDKSVAGGDPQYAEVFSNYDGILNEVVREASGTVLEFGVGTGNLSEKLLQAGLDVVGIEPSNAMREVAKEKFPEFTVLEGDFIDFPTPEKTVDTIVSTYAFHHLTDEEKDRAISQFSNLLPAGGKIVYGDTMFESELAKNSIIREAEGNGFTDLVEDLKREYYPLIDTMKKTFAKHDFVVSFKQMNKFVWLVSASKK